MPQSEAAPPLWRATVPVFLAVLDRMEAELVRAEAALGEGMAAALAQRPSPAMMPAGRQVATAVQFMLRIAFPLAGQRIPELRGALDAPGLRERMGAARELLRRLDAAAFAGAEARTITTQAGFAVLELPGEAYVHEFGLPNLYFHHAMAHVALKQAGVSLGKADFDGKHDYPEGFTFG
ncbi:DUF1993 family protein [Amaricoccus sp.]|uniref:DUF1993 family protein n=1 Tax=Amaricoccus sp. TaxID=1872485 RepID=UPI002606EFE7|nr:DUF1993 family protein [Amaricoccus sp.]HRO10149.1 DUF1993 family protein [Amaricoccus sp.]